LSLLRCNPQDHGLSGGDPLLSHVRVHVASSTSTAAFAARSTPAVPSAARHFLHSENEI
ncbi:hypothetical protein T4A_8853, partial [Trichinella pseudospiralis]